MNKRISSVLLKSVRYKTPGITAVDRQDGAMTDRQERVHGFIQDKAKGKIIKLIGAGGLGGEIAQGLVRKGYCEDGRLEIFDPDVVTAPCLTRQRFYEEDLYQLKAVCLARNLVSEAVKRLEIVGYPTTIQEAVEANRLGRQADLVICGPDNDDTRVYISRVFGRDERTPVVIAGLSRDADWGYVFVQIPGGPCFGCLKGRLLSITIQPCPNTPAVIDLVKVVAGLVLFATDTVLMERKRDWNYKTISLSGFIPDKAMIVDRNRDCPICGSG